MKRFKNGDRIRVIGHYDVELYRDLHEPQTAYLLASCLVPDDEAQS